MRTIKKFFKTLFIILLICLIGFVGYRYYKLKKDGKLDDVFASNKKDESLINNSDLYSSNKNSDDKNKDDSNSENKGNDSVELIERKNYDDYYNTYNFDNVLLLYEGKQYVNTTRDALDRMLETVDDTLYSRPTLVFENFSGLSKNTVTATDLDEYKTVLKQARNSLTDGWYEFTFGYTALNAQVNKIIITKK